MNRQSIKINRKINRKVAMLLDLSSFINLFLALFRPFSFSVLGAVYHNKAILSKLSKTNLVEKSPTELTQCFSINGPPHLFISGSFEVK